MGTLMPFAAKCYVCGEYFIGEDFFEIRKKLSKHFNEKHGRDPSPNPWFLDFNEDFRKEYVELLYEDPVTCRSRFFTFTTRYYKSSDYIIVVITHNDYIDAKHYKEQCSKNNDLHCRLYKSLLEEYFSQIK